jgi:hypothetical protein
MTLWTYAVSWSKMKLALECPRQLQLTIDKVPHGRPEQTYYTHRGHLVQKVFELYFNPQINLKKGGQRPEVIAAAADRVIPPYLKENQIDYPVDKTEADLTKEAKQQITNGFDIMAGIGLLNRRVRSEVKLNGVFRGFRMFAMVDFLAETPEGDLLYDGKGHQEKNADPRQVLYYALNRASAGRKVPHAGLIYWQHDFEPVDTSPTALRHFIDTDLAAARPTFELLKHGTNLTLETQPSPKTCRYCNWNKLCEDSYYKPRPADPNQKEEVGFGEPVYVET